MANASPAARLVRMLAPSAAAPNEQSFQDDVAAFERSVRYLKHRRASFGREAAVGRLEGWRDAELALAARARTLRELAAKAGTG